MPEDKKSKGVKKFARKQKKQAKKAFRHAKSFGLPKTKKK